MAAIGGHYCLYGYIMKKALKHIWRVFFGLFLLIVAIHAVSALTWDRKMQYTETTFTSPKIGPELDGYVIAFVTDTHELPAAKLKAVADNISARNVGVLLLGGDYHEFDAETTMAILGKVQTKNGVFGVEGNHDRAPKIFALMQKHGITSLDNSGTVLKKGLYLAGVADLWNRWPDIAAAVKNAQSEDLVLLASHNPDVAMEYDTAGVDIMLCGHTHGGEMTFFGLWAPALSIGVTQCGQKFKGGWTDNGKGTFVYVSRGTGLRQRRGLPFLWPRVFCPPQVVFLTLKAKL